ncbi:TPA: hypothetical protein ACGU9W_001249 [Vibrio vulnificus]|nr:hypothetical protein [Vibrio vulnificus]
MIKILTYTTLAINILLSLVALLTENDWILYNSYYFYTVQFLMYLGVILLSVRYACQFLMPSMVMFLYLSFSFSLGAKLVPHGFGFLTVDFIDSIINMKEVKWVTFYWLNTFNALFYVTMTSLIKQNSKEININGGVKSSYLMLGALIATFMLVSSFRFFGTFGMQIALSIVICTHIISFPRLVKLGVYCVLIISAVIFNYENKREVLMIFMTVFFIFSYTYKVEFKLNMKNFIAYSMILFLFVSSILVSSILRGYGGFGVTKFTEAVSYIPAYIQSDTFSDTIIDNFEISHTYPAAVLPVEYIMTGQLDLLVGSSIIKPLFLPLPRDIVPFKPDSVISIFTTFQAPSVHSIGGSFPVAFPSELFVNFHFLGLIFLVFFSFVFNKIYMSLFKNDVSGMKFKSALSFTVLLFILIRGGGADLLFVSFLSSLIVIFISSVNGNHLKL